ncbi:hypothetical protein JTE90_020026 [Oedothorax gibbosus]|uniref:Sushi domain-containing protein n=1 Tax=Oedothorax gibbosus TaxID=931172 RepID=A0AAV6U002_9ARAC|nr:hypothetical protein JTE90_020026 [Oedothorax gibbosus]
MTPNEKVQGFLCLIFLLVKCSCLYADLQLISCNDPGYIENAVRMGNVFTFPNNITYLCDEGFKMYGTPTRYCSPKGHWLPKAPVCLAIICPFPPEIQNGKVISSERNLHAVVRYECDRYFNLSGNAERTCQEDGTWSGDVPVCNEITCPDPGVIEHVRVIPPRPQLRRAGDFVIFKCKYGSHHQISSRCLETGEWNKRPPMCPVQLISCNDPGYIENAVRMGNVFTFPSNITYLCDEGFKMYGTPTRYCSPKGHWLPKAPVCLAIICPFPSEIQNGKVISSERNLHAVVRYECDRYFNLSGNTERTCQEDGTWSGDVPVCNEITCPDPGVIEHVRVIPPRPQLRRAGDFVIFKCKYGSHHQISSRCLETGEWNKRPPMCPGPSATESVPDSAMSTLSTKVQLISCKDPGYIENALRIGNVFTFPNNITYVCNEGFKMFGAPTRYCSPKGHWLPKAPVCLAIICPFPSEIQNGKVISSERNLHAVVRYECDRYFNLSGNAERTCQEDGTWSGDVPVCNEITCPDPGVIEHVRVIPPRPQLRRAGDFVIFKCKYGSHHQISSRCLETGEWNKRPPMCPGPSVTESVPNSAMATLPTDRVATDQEKLAWIVKTAFIGQGKYRSNRTSLVYTIFPMEQLSKEDEEGTKTVTGFGNLTLEKLVVYHNK